MTNQLAHALHIVRNSGLSEALACLGMTLAGGIIWLCLFALFGGC